MGDINRDTQSMIPQRSVVLSTIHPTAYSRPLLFFVGVFNGDKRCFDGEHSDAEGDDPARQRTLALFVGLIHTGRLMAASATVDSSRESPWEEGNILRGAAVRRPILMRFVGDIQTASEASTSLSGAQFFTFLSCGLTFTEVKESMARGGLLLFSWSRVWE